MDTYLTVPTVSEDVVLDVESIVQLQEWAAVTVIVAVIVGNIVGDGQHSSKKVTEDNEAWRHLSNS